MISAAILLLVGLPAAQRELSVLERRLGWQVLSSAEPGGGWTALDGGPLRSGWTLADGALICDTGGGDALSHGAFEDFELEFEWRVAPGGNGGVKYRLQRAVDGAPKWSAVGCEYQVLDDAAHPDGKQPGTRAGALYALAPAGEHPEALAGAWHAGRIVARDAHLEHWIGTTRVVSLDTQGDAFRASLAASKFAGVASFGRGASPILLQDHGDPVGYRDLVIRDWNALPGQAVELFDGRTLAGWWALGDARYTVVDAAPDAPGGSPGGAQILGEVGGGAQSFLASERTFGDFVLELDVKTLATGNSGIQIRSHETPDGQRLFGYQVEIDPSERAWSGGLYDEARRGWLDDLSDNAAARAAFGIGAWNRYRIECMGPWIRTWINGVPAADRFDFVDLEGRFGLQVHSGTGTRVQWRDFRLQDLGRHQWEPVDLAGARAGRAGAAAVELVRDDQGSGFDLGGPGGPTFVGTELAGDFALRFDVLATAGVLNVGVLPEPDFEWLEALSAYTTPIGEHDVSEAACLDLPRGFGITLSHVSPGFHSVVLARYGDRCVVELDGEQNDWRTFVVDGESGTDHSAVRDSARLLFQLDPSGSGRCSVRNVARCVPAGTAGASAPVRSER